MSHRNVKIVKTRQSVESIITFLDRIVKESNDFFSSNFIVKESPSNLLFYEIKYTIKCLYRKYNTSIIIKGNVMFFK